MINNNNNNNSNSNSNNNNKSNSGNSKIGPKEQQLLSEGESYYLKQNYPRSEKVLLEVLEINPENIEALFILGNLYYNTGQIDKGIKSFQKLLEIDPGHTEAAICLSVLYNDIGKYQEAKKLFGEVDKRVKRNDPSISWNRSYADFISYPKNKNTNADADADNNSSNTHSIADTYAIASNATLGGSSERAYLNDPYINKKFAFKHYEIGDMYLTYDRYDEALFEFGKSIRLDPSNLEARIQVAKVYAKKGLLAKAIEELRRLKNEYPNYSPARISLGILYYGNGHVVEAQAEWQRVLHKDSQNKEARMYLELSKSATETKFTE